jgi:hypothetical protein
VSVFSKCTHLEIHEIVDEQLALVSDIEIYGRVSALHLYRPQVCSPSLLTPSNFGNNPLNLC